MRWKELYKEEGAVGGGGSYRGTGGRIKSINKAKISRRQLRNQKERMVALPVMMRRKQRKRLEREKRNKSLRKADQVLMQRGQ